MITSNVARPSSAGGDEPGCLRGAGVKAEAREGRRTVRRALTPASTALTLHERRPRADLQEDTIQSSATKAVRRNGTASA